MCLFPECFLGCFQASIFKVRGEAREHLLLGHLPHLRYLAGAVRVGGIAVVEGEQVQLGRDLADAVFGLSLLSTLLRY